MYVCAGGVIVEQDENDRLVAKPYNVAEANKQRALEQEQAPVQSLVTASMMAMQNKVRASNDSGNYLMANSIRTGNDISPSFQNTHVPAAKAAPDGGPMTFEPNSFA